MKNILRRLKNEYLPEWLDLQTAILFVIVISITIFLLWGQPIVRSVAGSQTTLTLILTPTSSMLAATPLPPEWENNSQQTNAIVLAGVILLLIIVVGTLSEFRARKI